MAKLVAVFRGLNCLSAGSVSLTIREISDLGFRPVSQLPFGWVCFSNSERHARRSARAVRRLNCLSAGSVSLTKIRAHRRRVRSNLKSQLPFGWVCFSNPRNRC